MGTPKALLAYEGETFLDRLIGVLGSYCEPVVVVAGRHAGEIRAAAKRGQEVTFVENPDPDRGQLSSLQCALGVMPASSDFLFLPVDFPSVREETIRTLAERFTARGNDSLFVIPRYRGRRGHPVCADKKLAAEFLALPANAEAREVVHKHRERTLYVDVDDPGVVTDVDTPEDYARLVGRG